MFITNGSIFILSMYLHKALSTVVIGKRMNRNFRYLNNRYNMDIGKHFKKLYYSQIVN